MSERKRVFVLEFSPVVASDGSTQTFLFSTQGFSTGAADTPSNAKVKPFLSNPGSLKRDLFSDARVTGAVKPNYGNVVLRNPVQTKGGSGELDAWVDYGLAGTRIKCYWGVPGDAYPGSWKLVYIAYCHSFLADVNELVFRLRDQLQLLDNSLAAEGFLGSGGLEGNGGISKPKQWISGDPGFITPILVDYAKQIYLVQINGCFNPDLYLTNPTPINNFDVFEGGVEIDRAQPNYTSAADILANSPTAGTVRYFFGPANPLMAGWFDGPVYFRLGSPPANDLRVYPQGVPTSAEMLAWGSAFGSYTADLLAVRAGVPRTSIASGSAMLPVASVLVDDASSYLSVLSGAALAYQGFFGFTRLDTFKSGFLCSPEDDGYYYGVTSSSGLGGWPPAAVPTTSLHTFNTDQLKDFKREPVSGMEVPIWSVQVSAGKTQASKILAGASNEMKDYLSRDPYWVTVTGYSASTVLANPGAAAAVVEIPGRVLQNSFATRMWLERYFVLYGGRRHFYTFSVPMTDALLDLELHDVVTLQGPRYGLSSGKKFRIVGLVLDCSAAVPMMAFTCWGGDIGQYTGGGVPGVIWGGGGGGGGTNTVENIARQSLGLFTGQMIGDVSVGSSSSTSGSDSVIAPFTGQLIGVAEYDQYFGLIRALLHGNGSNGATTTVDSSNNVKTVTVQGSATLSTTQMKFGTASLYCPNTGVSEKNGWKITDHTDFDFGTSDWTIGCWVYRAANTYVGTIWVWPGSGTTRLSVDTGGVLRLQYADSGGSVDRFLQPVLPLTTWTFLEVCRRGADIEVWMDGFIICREVRNVTYTQNTSGDIYVGCESINSTQCFNGYIDEFCITATVARPSYYHFPASAADPNWSSTVLLMQGGSFADSSSYGKTITTSGSPTIGSGTVLMDNSYYQGAASSYFKAALGTDGSMTADFTVEMSVSGSGSNVIFMSEGPASYLYNNSYQSYGGTSLVLPTNYGSHERHMLAISRVGSSLKAFLDGKVVDTKTYSGTIDLQNLRFGHYIPNNNLYWTGAWDDIRITKGVGRWSANYTISQNVPTTPYFPG